MATFHRFLLSMCFMVIAGHHHHVDSFNLAAAHPCRMIPPIPYTNTDKRKPHHVCRMSTEVDDDTMSITQDEQDLHDIDSLNGLDINYDDYDNEGEMSDGAEIINNKKRIECSASIMLPFSADVAFTAFSDLTRQPSWCKYLYNVEYIDSEVNDNDDDVGTSPSPILRASKWTVGVKGLRFSWKARDTKIIRPHRIEWESTSGLKNIGSVVFTPDNNNSTHMKLCFIFVLPRVVSSLYRKLNIRKYTEDVMLADMLQQFRDVVIREDL